jgi:hypothetical protein
MGVMVNKETSKRTELTDRIAADLRTRARQDSNDDPDLVEDSDYVRNYNKTGKFSWVWAVLIIFALISAVLIVTI